MFLYSAAPHSPQNLVPGALSAPHFAQLADAGVSSFPPHSPQNLVPGAF
jgi:hypothetical protein